MASCGLMSSFSLHDDIVMPDFTAWSLPASETSASAMCTGELIAAIAMTEPGTGSDLRAIRTAARKVEGGWRLDGAKTFITSGIQSDLVIVVSRTESDGGPRGFSLLVVEAGAAVVSRGRKLDKIGLAAQDTAELLLRRCLRSRRESARC